MGAYSASRITWVVLALIFFIGLFLRLWNTEKRGISFYDEAFYALEANTFAKLPSLAIPILKDRPLTGAEGREFIHKHFPEGFFPTTTARPGYVLGLALAMFLHPNQEMVALAFSALAGSLTIIVLFLLVLHLTKNPVAAAGASFLLALSPYHVLYSRIVYPHIFTALILALGVFVYLKSFQKPHHTVFRWLFFSGALLGYAFSTHVNVLPLVFLWALFEGVVAFLKYRKDLVGRLGVFFAGLMLPLAFWQACLWFKGRIMAAFGSAGLGEGYVGELLGVLLESNVRGNRFSFTDAAYYADVLQYLDGTFFLALAGASVLFYFLFRGSRDVSHAFVFYLTTGFLLIYSFTSLRASRTLVVVLPLLIAIVAVFLWRVCNKVPFRGVGVALFLGLIGYTAWANLGSLASVVRLESGYRKATEMFLALPGNETRIGSLWATFQWHAKQRVYSSADIALNSGEGDYFIVGAESTFLYPIEQAFERAREPLAVVQNPVWQFYPIARDLLYGRSRSETEEALQHPGMGTIRIYKL